MSPEKPRIGDYREQWRTDPVDGEVAFDFWYPSLEGEITHIRVGLMDVRAADDIRISYDFERDGWLIEQASVFSWTEPPYDEGWREAAFIPAWQFRPLDDLTDAPTPAPEAATAPPGPGMGTDATGTGSGGPGTR